MKRGRGGRKFCNGIVFPRDKKKQYTAIQGSFLLHLTLNKLIIDDDIDIKQVFDTIVAYRSFEYNPFNIMGNQCSEVCYLADLRQDELKADPELIVLAPIQQPKPIPIIADRISKSKVQAQLPSVPAHIQAKIQKLSSHYKEMASLAPQQRKLRQPKIYKSRYPFNFVYMNLEQRPEPYPIGKSIIYKLKDRDEFAGYFEGILKEDFTISPQGSLIVFPNGCYFEGLSEKEGVYLNETTGLRYQGGWADETPSGFGKEKSNKGSYEGNYEKGCKHGKGKFTWADGSFYEGEFVRGLFQGSGVLVNQKERYSYAGQFKSGTRNGYGKENNSKEQYEGQFEYDERSGRGKLSIRNSQTQKMVKVYEGEFFRNKPHGDGKMSIFIDQTMVQSFEGIWKKGSLVCLAG